MPGPMPDPSSPQFMTWLQGYDQQTQQAILRELGMDMASGNAASTQGGYAPSLTGFAYDVPSMIGGIPMSTNSKGEPNPQNLEQAQKRLNYGQDVTGSAGLGNNMLSWMTGGQGTDPSAWKPTRVGMGSPVQFKGQSNIEAFANSGGDDWQSYIAARIAGGDTPAMAITKLKKMVQGSDETGGVSPASPDFLASLPSSPDYEGAVPGQDEPDIKTDRGFATLFSVKDIQGFANDLFKGVADDRALQSTSWQDPKTGQWYSGYEDKKTEQMEAADKLGLAYPTQSYADDDYIKAYQQKMLGSDDTYDAMDRQARVTGAQDTLAAANRKATDEQDYMSAVRAAYDSAHPAPRQLDPAKNFGLPPTTGLGSSPTPTYALPPTTGMGVPAAVPGAPAQDPRANFGGMVGRGTAPQSVDDVLGPGWMTPDVMSQVLPMSGSVSASPQVAGGLAPELRVAPTRDTRATAGLPLSYDYTAEDITGGAPTPVSNTSIYEMPEAQAVKSATKGKKPKTVQDLGSAYALGSTLAPGRKEVEEATRRKTTANKTRSDAQQAYYKSQFMNDDEMSRAQVAATMRYLAHQGRSPMQDQLAARSQTIRNLIGY